MKTIENRGSGADSRAVAEAAEVLRRGGIVIYPTDTLYALGCDALNSRAVERLCRIKGINPERNYLSIVCHDISQAADYARIDNRAFAILRRSLPGPFTFVLPSATALPKVFRGRRSVGVRIPDCDFARALAEELGHPVMTSSAVPADADDDYDASEADGASVALDFDGFSEIELAVDAGCCAGIPSTIIDLTDSTEPEIIRQGAGELSL